MRVLKGHIILGQVQISIGDFILVIKENTFQELAKNYLRDALINTGSFIPINWMVAQHDAGSTTVSVSKTTLGVGECRIDASFPVTLEMKNIDEIDLLSSSGIYSKVYVPNFTKKAGEDFNVIWTIKIL